MGVPIHRRAPQIHSLGSVTLDGLPPAGGLALVGGVTEWHFLLS